MSELEAVIAEEKAKLVESKKLRMLYLDEEDMIEAGVMDAAECVDVMEETMGTFGRRRLHHGWSGA